MLRSRFATSNLFATAASCICLFAAVVLAHSLSPCDAFAPPAFRYELASPRTACSSRNTAILSSSSGGEDGSADGSASDQVMNSLMAKLSTPGTIGTVAVADAKIDEKVVDTTNEAKASAAPSSSEDKSKDNKSMAFLRRIGRVGGANNKDFANACGTDEGSTGLQPPSKRSDGPVPRRKARSAYRECTASGTIDDLSEPFPITSCGTEWRGVSDRVRGGESNGVVRRVPDVQGRVANVLSGRVNLVKGQHEDDAFIQMVTDLMLDPASPSVDASQFDGIEVDVLTRNMDSFNVHVRTPGTLQQSSYRYTRIVDEDVDSVWQTVRVPWTSFMGCSDGRAQDECDVVDMGPLDPAELRRVGFVAIGREMDVYLAVSGLRFYSVF